MAALLQQTTDSGTGSVTLTLTGVTAGSSLVLKYAQNGSASRTYSASGFTSAVAYNPGRAVGILVRHNEAGGSVSVTLSANTGTAAVRGWLLEVEGLDPLATPIIPSTNGVVDGSAATSHDCAPAGEIDTTGAAMLFCVGVTDGNVTAFGAGGSYALLGNGGSVREVAQYRTALSALTDHPGAYTSTGTPRTATSTLAAFPLLAEDEEEPLPEGFTAWLEDDSTTRVVLAELQPAEHLTGTWNSQGPTNPLVYATSWPAFIATSVIPGGMYRRLDYVRENDVTLTLQTSVAACQSTPGSYYLNTSTGTLYVSTTGGVNPSTIAALAAYFTLFVATAPMDFVGDRLYDPLLTGELPASVVEAEDPFNAFKSLADGTLTLVNAHGVFDALSTAYIWRNKLVRLFVGGGTMLRADYVQVASVRIDALTVDDAVTRLAVRSLVGLLDRTLPLRTFTAAAFPFAAEEVGGTYQPLLWGLVRDIPAPCVDAYHRREPDFTGAPAGFSDVYRVADPDAQVLTGVLAVRAVERSTGEMRALSAESYSVNLTACTVTVTDATFRADQWQVRVDATGETDGGGGYLRTAGAIARDILLTLGEQADAIDDASFTAADVSAPFQIGLWVSEPQQASEVIVRLQQSVIGSVHTGSDGLWRMYVLDLANVSTVGSLEAADIAEWAPVERIDPIYPEVRVFFAENPATGEASLTTAEDTATRWLYDTPDGLSVHTALVDLSEAIVIAQRYRLLATRADVQVDVTPRGVGLIAADLYDRVLVTRQRAPGGPYVAVPMEILRLERTLDPLRVRVRLGNLGGLSALLGGSREISSVGLTWGTATTEQRATLAFIGDSNGEVATGVPNPTILW